MSEIDPELLHEAMCFVYAQPDGVAVSSVEGGEIVARAVHQDRQRHGWQPIETAPRGDLLLLYYPKIVGRNALPEMIQADHYPVSHTRQPTLWMSIKWPSKRAL